jgi:hypothetical protein
VRAAHVGADQQRQLLLRLGVALRELGRYDEAIDVLRSLDLTPDDGSYLLWAQQLALALRRRGERRLETGQDPEEPWRAAQELLDEAVALGDDPETCGIAAGLQKRRGLRALDGGDRLVAAQHLQAAADLYERGFAAAPTDYYTGLNAVTTLRILAQHLGGSAGQLSRALDLAPVVQFFAERAATGEDFWAVVSVAELVLTRHLLDAGPTALDVERAYARAHTGPGPVGARPAGALPATRGRRRPPRPHRGARALLPGQGCPPVVRTRVGRAGWAGTVPGPRHELLAEPRGSPWSTSSRAARALIVLERTLPTRVAAPAVRRRVALRPRRARLSRLPARN